MFEPFHGIYSYYLKCYVYVGCMHMSTGMSVPSLLLQKSTVSTAVYRRKGLEGLTPGSDSRTVETGPVWSQDHKLRVSISDGTHKVEDAC